MRDTDTIVNALDTAPALTPASFRAALNEWWGRLAIDRPIPESFTDDSFYAFYAEVRLAALRRGGDLPAQPPEWLISFCLGFNADKKYSRPVYSFMGGLEKLEV